MDEIKEVLGGDDEGVMELISAADVDGDGEISFEEFSKMMLKIYKA